MQDRQDKPASRLWRRTEGTAVVEFAIVGGLLLLLVMGILDFGHAWFLRQTIINASREGARYAVIYRVDEAGDRLKPSALDPSVKSFTETLLGQMLPSGAVFTATPSGTGFTNGATGQEVTVTVTVQKEWFAVHAIASLFGGGWTSPTTLTAATTMRVE